MKTKAVISNEMINKKKKKLRDRERENLQQLLQQHRFWSPWR
jgi:hypothetical protein